MKKALRFLLLALLVPLMLQSAKPATAQWFVGIHVGFGPPALPVYEQPICPGPDYIWTPGYWAWDADDGYYWVPGTWIIAPEPEFLWTPGWWGWGTGGYFWHEGYWGPHVGFYGGINYGFGYFGTGFWGGRWQGGHFFYNTAVWHVGGGIRNVYRDETIINERTIINNHISYNGGEGGISRRPTPEEESYANERHIAPIEGQNRQVEAAHGNPQLRASVNQGRPAIAATARPGEFSGGGVVQAREAGGEYHAQPMAHEAQPGGEGARPGNPAHASELPQHQPQHVESTGNPNLDRKYQQQQQQLADRQNQEHQQLQQRQEQEHQQAQQRNYSPQQTQQLEQKHQQQTQQLEQKHQQQTQKLV
ncbi:MAG: YXWGXW repeat-containing protein, partial [Terracidiphilus sp.]